MIKSIMILCCILFLAVISITIIPQKNTQKQPWTDRISGHKKEIQANVTYISEDTEISHQFEKINSFSAQGITMPYIVQYEIDNHQNPQFIQLNIDQSFTDLDIHTANSREAIIIQTPLYQRTIQSDWAGKLSTRIETSNQICVSIADQSICHTVAEGGIS